MPSNNYNQKILSLASEHGIVRPRDLKKANIPSVYLQRMVAAKQLVKLTRGLYALPDYEPSEFATIAEACKKVPSGIVCLLSALRVHGLTTQNPFEVWLMIDREAWRPTFEYPPLRVIRASGKSLSTSVIQKNIDGVNVLITSPAKTIADCFKFRNKIGIDVAVEALRDCYLNGRATLDEISQCAKIDRVANVMRPYMEALQ